MLRALSIENIAVAKNLDIEFTCGFTVLTGKTGAGKSVITDSLTLLLGGKGNRELIRSGEETAEVTAVFVPSDTVLPRLEELGVFPDSEGEITVTRTVSRDGRNTGKINRRSVPLSLIRAAGAMLVSMHSQNEAVILYDKNEYIRFLDEYADCGELLSRYGGEYSQLCAKKRELEELKKALEDKSALTEILKLQAAEIDKTRLNDFDEEEKLERLRARLKNAEHITKSALLVTRALAPSEKNASAAYLLERASAALLNLGDVLEGAADMAARLDEYRCDIIDIAERARELTSDGQDEDPQRQLDRIEARLSLIARLKKKYGGSIEEILRTRRNMAERLRDLDEGEVRIDELEKEYAEQLSRVKQTALELSKIRRQAAFSLTGEVMETLKYLDMPKVRFAVEIRQLPEESEGLGKKGCDEVDFLVCTNPGEPLASLGKIASGGELSRIMLALKSAQAKQAGVDTVVFDEIDTGVSGGTAERIGIKLKQLAEASQVICVTHSPQVSARADMHLLIEKNEVNGRAESSVRALNESERAEELARMIGGIDITETQMSAAREMLSE